MVRNYWKRSRPNSATITLHTPRDFACTHCTPDSVKPVTRNFPTILLVTKTVFYRRFSVTFFFLWCILWKSSANEHSLFNREHFSQALTYSEWKIKQKNTALGWLALTKRDHTALSSANWLNKHSIDNLFSWTIKEHKIENVTAFTEAHHQIAQHISVHFTEQCKMFLTLTLLMWRIRWAPNNASRWQMEFNLVFNPLNAKLNPICHLLALLGAHPILHISRKRVKGLVHDL